MSPPRPGYRPASLVRVKEVKVLHPVGALERNVQDRAACHRPLQRLGEGVAPRLRRGAQAAHEGAVAD